MSAYLSYAAQAGHYFDRPHEDVLREHVVPHARTAYEDDPDPARKRRLLRLWLSI